MTGNSPMRAFLDTFGFELRYQSRVPLFWVLLVLFFVVHFLTMGTNNITIGEINTLIHLTSPYQVVIIEIGLAYFGLLPAIYFAVTAATRDHDRRTMEFFYTTPIDKLPFLAGRFCGGLTFAVLVAVAGLLGCMAGLLPSLAGATRGAVFAWVDPSRIGPFSLMPFAYSFFVFTLPYTFVVCAIFFATAALTRSLVFTFIAAIVFMLLSVSLILYSDPDSYEWLSLLDPTGAIAVRADIRYWTVAELDLRYPGIMLLENRTIWIGLAVAALAFACRRFRLALPEGTARSRWTRVRNAFPEPAPAPAWITAAPDFSPAGQLAIFRITLVRDLALLIRSPLFLVVLFLAIVDTVGEHGRLVDPLENPLLPVTSLMLAFFRYGLLHYVLLLLIYFSGELVHRDRDHGVHEITSASACPDWIGVMSKITSLCAVITLLLAASMLTSVALQALAGYTDFEIGLYLKGIFLYYGFYFYMCCVLTVLVQTLSPNKWAGMAALTALFVFLFSMDALGLENILYQFSIPIAPHSYMNGFGPYEARVLSLTAYWAAFCLLLVIAATMLSPRGYPAGPLQRLRDARARLTPALAFTAVVGAGAFGGAGAWIYYNTHILNTWETRESRLRKEANYELLYGQYESLPAPDYLEIEQNLDLSPEDPRLRSRGLATIFNSREGPIREFALTVDPRMEVNRLEVASTRPLQTDTALGFHLFEFTPPLEPGATSTIRWDMQRVQRGFANGSPELDLVENGTYVGGADLMPVPGYRRDRNLVDSADRRRFGLPAAPRLPALGDPRYLNVLKAGVTRRAMIRTTVSTAADQVAVVPGVLVREWLEGGRRYFRYESEGPMWPVLSLSSARYEVSRDRWQDVELAVYHDPRHAPNARGMLATARLGLAYFSREFGDYGIPYFRILEFPRYRTFARAGHGTVSYSEAVGFITDTSRTDGLDYATLHELAHMWWGNKAYGAYMQGRQMLNETLAQYSTLMVFSGLANPVPLRRILAHTHDAYLLGRGFETHEEQPLMLTEDQGYISYNKGALVFFALQEIIGADKVHLALRNYLGKFTDPPPFPMSRDVVDELRAVAGPEYQDLITDLFEKIVLYDLAVNTARASSTDGGFDVRIDYTVRQFEADGHGVETEVPLNGWFDVVVFPDSDVPLIEQMPLYAKKHQLRSGAQQITVHVKATPGRVGLDPWHKMIDRTPRNNVSPIDVER